MDTKIITDYSPSYFQAGNDLQTANEDQQLKRRHKHSNKPDVRAFNTQTEDGISGSWWEKRQLCCILIFLGKHTNVHVLCIAVTMHSNCLTTRLYYNN